MMLISKIKKIWIAAALPVFFTQPLFAEVNESEQFWSKALHGQLANQYAACIPATELTDSTRRIATIHAKGQFVSLNSNSLVHGQETLASEEGKLSELHTSIEHKAGAIIGHVKIVMDKKVVFGMEPHHCVLIEMS